jgi:hypothetical protein
MTSDALFTTEELQSLGLREITTPNNSYRNYKLEKIADRYRLRLYNRMHSKNFTHNKQKKQEKSYYLPKDSTTLLKQRRPDSVHRTKARLVDIVRCNRTPNTWFVTFTYAENQLDRKVAQTDFRNCIRRLETYLKRSVGYAFALEQQQRGAWHIHAVIFDIPYFNNEDWSSIFWKKGFVKRNQIRDDKVAFYLTKYITKEALLALDTRGYSCSHGLRRPIEIESILEVYKELYKTLASKRIHIIKRSKEYPHRYLKGATTQYCEIFSP